MDEAQRWQKKSTLRVPSPYAFLYLNHFIRAVHIGQR